MREVNPIRRLVIVVLLSLLSLGSVQASIFELRLYDNHRIFGLAGGTRGYDFGEDIQSVLPTTGSVIAFEKRLGVDGWDINDMFLYQEARPDNNWKVKLWGLAPSDTYLILFWNEGEGGEFVATATSEFGETCSLTFGDVTTLHGGEWQIVISEVVPEPSGVWVLIMPIITLVVRACLKRRAFFFTYNPTVLYNRSIR